MSPLHAYAGMLAAQGLIVSAISGGKLDFKYEGDTYALLTYADDPHYVGISASYRIPTGAPRSTLLKEANELTRRSKVVKVCMLPGRGVTVSVELFLAEPEHFEPILLRVLRLVQSTSSGLFVRLTERELAKT